MHNRYRCTQSRQGQWSVERSKLPRVVQMRQKTQATNEILRLLQKMYRSKCSHLWKQLNGQRCQPTPKLLKSFNQLKFSILFSGISTQAYPSPRSTQKPQPSVTSYRQLRDMISKEDELELDFDQTLTSKFLAKRVGRAKLMVPPLVKSAQDDNRDYLPQEDQEGIFKISTLFIKSAQQTNRDQFSAGEEEKDFQKILSKLIIIQDNSFSYREKKQEIEVQINVVDVNEVQQSIHILPLLQEEPVELNKEIIITRRIITEHLDENEEEENFQLVSYNFINSRNKETLINLTLESEQPIQQVDEQETIEETPQFNARQPNKIMDDSEVFGDVKEIYEDKSIQKKLKLANSTTQKMLPINKIDIDMAEKITTTHADEQKLQIDLQINDDHVTQNIQQCQIYVPIPTASRLKRRSISQGEEIEISRKLIYSFSHHTQEASHVGPQDHIREEQKLNNVQIMNKSTASKWKTVQNVKISNLFALNKTFNNQVRVFMPTLNTIFDDFKEKDKIYSFPQAIIKARSIPLLTPKQSIYSLLGLLNHKYTPTSSGKKTLVNVQLYKEQFEIEERKQSQRFKQKQQQLIKFLILLLFIISFINSLTRLQSLEICL